MGMPDFRHIDLPRSRKGAPRVRLVGRLKPRNSVSEYAERAVACFCHLEMTNRPGYLEFDCIGFDTLYRGLKSENHLLGLTLKLFTDCLHIEKIICLTPICLNRVGRRTQRREMAISNTIELAPMWTLLLYCSMIGCNIYYLHYLDRHRFQWIPARFFVLPILISIVSAVFVMLTYCDVAYSAKADMDMRDFYISYIPLVSILLGILILMEIIYSIKISLSKKKNRNA